MTNPCAGIPLPPRPGWCDYELKILAGDLYEVWLQHDWEEPKLCVPVIQIAIDAFSPNWEVLVDGQIEEVHAGQIFRTGTATRPMPPFAMPIIKKVVSPLFINEIVSVQPMTMPTGLSFYMDYKYGEVK